MRLPALLTIVTSLLATASPGLAETVHCADAKGEIAVEYDVVDGAVTRVQMQINDDFGISTDPAHEDHSGEKLAEQSVSAELVDVTLRVDGGPPALKLKLVMASEGVYWLRAGVIAVGGGGLWAIACDR